MTVTQIRFSVRKAVFTRREGLRIQGFEVSESNPIMGLSDENGFSRFEAFKAIGNAVHVDVVEWIAAGLLGLRPSSPEHVRGEGPTDDSQQALPLRMHAGR